MKQFSNFWVLFFALIFSLSLVTPTSFALTCQQIREKAEPKKGKATCLLLEHTIGLNRGTTISTYSCGGAKYTLHTEEDFTCKVTKGAK